jgi:hypothetical protein
MFSLAVMRSDVSSLAVILICVAVVWVICTRRRWGSTLRTCVGLCWTLCLIACFFLVVFAVSSRGRHSVMQRHRHTVTTFQHVDQRSRIAKNIATELAIAARNDRGSRAALAARIEGTDPVTAEAEWSSGAAETAAASDEKGEEHSQENTDSLGESGPTVEADVESDERLSIESLAHAQIDFEARPPWVDRPAEQVGEALQVSVASGPFLRLAGARRELDQQLKLAVDTHINEWLGHPGAARWIDWNPDRIRAALVAPEHVFDEQVISPSFGSMHQSHALLEFGPGFHREIERAWHEVVARAQLVRITLLAAAVLGVLAMLFGYLQADTATRGFYAGRLKFATGVAILGWLALGIVLARSIPWLHL